MSNGALPAPLSAHRDATVERGSRGVDERFKRLLVAHYGFVWRQLRRFGLSPENAEDAAQAVFLIVQQRLDDIRPGSEVSFLFGTARRVASETRRTIERRRETHGDGTLQFEDPAPHADELLDQARAHSLLEQLLGKMEEDLRTVFMLFELEDKKMVEIQELLGIPLGTVASRLRRARAEFHSLVAQVGETRAHGAES